MSRWTAVLAVVGAAGVAALAPGTAPARAAAGAARAGVASVDAGGRVLLVSYPRVTWSLVDDVGPPVLLDLLGRSAVASLSVATAAVATDPADGYLTVGAGQRASAAARPASGDLGIVSGTAGVEVAAVAELATTAGSDLFGAEPGALGGALHAAGHVSAVVANADVVRPDGTVSLHREAALATMDPGGRSGGSVAEDLARPDPARPGGRVLDEDAVLEAFGRVWTPGAVVLVEASDLDRADRGGTPADLAGALRRSDALLARLLEQVDPGRDLVVLLAPAAPHDRAELTLFAMAGPGVEPGLARSPTTRRAGYVTLPDVAPTVLRALGLDAPAAMAGTAITSTTASVGTAAGERAALDRRSSFRERTVVPVTVAFLVLQLLVYLAVARWFAATRWRDVLAVGTLAVLAFPLLTFGSAAVGYEDLGVAGYILVLLAAAVAVAGAVWWASRRSTMVAAWSLVAATWAVLVVDALRGGPLQFDTPFGYSPISAARFAGMGNLGLALVMGTALVGVTGAWPLFWERRGAPDVEGQRAPGGLLAAAAAAFAVTVLADGLPLFGSDLGGVAAMVPAFVVAWLALSGRRVTWKQVGVAVGLGVAAVLAAAAIDLARPEGDRTHLGRFAQRVLDGEAGTIIHRKLATNLHVLLHPGVVLATVLGIGAAIVAWRRSTPFAEVRRRVPGVRALVSGGLVGAVLGFGVNDSGIVVPGMMLAVAVPWCIALAFALQPAVVGSGR